MKKILTVAIIATMFLVSAAMAIPAPLPIDMGDPNVPDTANDNAGSGMAVSQTIAASAEGNVVSQTASNTVDTNGDNAAVTQAVYGSAIGIDVSQDFSNTANIQGDDALLGQAVYAATSATGSSEQFGANNAATGDNSAVSQTVAVTGDSKTDNTQIAINAARMDGGWLSQAISAAAKGGDVHQGLYNMVLADQAASDTQSIANNLLSA